MAPNRYSEGEAQALLGLYQSLFPAGGAHWKGLKDYWDFSRVRPWSCLTTNFNDVTMDQVLALDGARRRWRPSGDLQKQGEDLSAMASTSGCGFSLGISPWTDSVLHSTVTQDTTSLVALIGHDWYPIVPKRGPIEARPPLDIFRLLDSTDPRWKGYADGLPSVEEFKQAGVGLLFLNLVPDFRPPNTSSEGAFPFHATTFDYSACVTGLLTTLESAHDHLPIRGVVTWGKPAWEALRDFIKDHEVCFGVSEAARLHGENGLAWASSKQPGRIHPFPHPTPGKRHLLWPQELEAGYRRMWQTLLG